MVVVAHANPDFAFAKRLKDAPRQNALCSKAMRSPSTGAKSEYGGG